MTAVVRAPLLALALLGAFASQGANAQDFERRLPDRKTRLAVTVTVGL